MLTVAATLLRIGCPERRRNRDQLSGRRFRFRGATLFKRAPLLLAQRGHNKFDLLDVLPFMASQQLAIEQHSPL